MKKLLVTATEAARALYIDFEGTMTEPPVLLGVYWVDDRGKQKFLQYVFEPRLRAAAGAKSLANAGTCIYVDSMEAALIEILDVVISENRLLVAWSSHEEKVVEGSSLQPSDRAALIARLRDAKATCKRWKNKFHKKVVFPRERRGGRNTLRNFMKLIGNEAPPCLRPAAARIRYVMKQLGKRGSYTDLTRVAKAKWTKLLAHNHWDCYGTREVLTIASRALEQKLRAA
jgi:hypothetical protein